MRAATSQKCEAVPRRARVQGSSTSVSLNSRLEKEEEEEEARRREQGRARLPRSLTHCLSLAQA